MKVSTFLVGFFLLFDYRGQNHFFVPGIVAKVPKKSKHKSTLPVPKPPQEADFCPLWNPNNASPLVEKAKIREVIYYFMDFPEVDSSGNAKGSRSVSKYWYYNAASVYYDEDGLLVTPETALGHIETTCTVKKGQQNNQGDIEVEIFECVDKTCDGHESSPDCVSSQSVETFQRNPFIFGSGSFSRENYEITCGTGLYEGVIGTLSSAEVVKPDMGIVNTDLVFESAYTIEIRSGPLLAQFETFVAEAGGEAPARDYILQLERLNLCNADVVSSLDYPSRYLKIKNSYDASIENEVTTDTSSFSFPTDKMNEYRQACNDEGLTFVTYPDLVLSCQDLEVSYSNFAKCKTDANACVDFDMNRFLIDYNNLVLGNGCEISRKLVSVPLPFNEVVADLDTDAELTEDVSVDTRSLQAGNCPNVCSKIQCRTNLLCAGCKFCVGVGIDELTQLPNDLCDTYCSPVQCGNSPMCTGCSFCKDKSPCKNIRHFLVNYSKFDNELCNTKAIVADYFKYGYPLMTPNFKQCGENACEGCEGCSTCDSWCSKSTCGGGFFPEVPNCKGCSFCQDPFKFTGTPCANYCSQRSCDAADCQGCTFCGDFDPANKDTAVCDSFCHINNVSPSCRDCMQVGQPLEGKGSCNECDSYCSALNCGFGEGHPGSECAYCDSCTQGSVGLIKVVETGNDGVARALPTCPLFTFPCK